MTVEIRLRCRWCGRPDVAGCDCEASQEIAHLKQQRDEAVRCSEESAEIMRRARARAEQAEAERDRLREASRRALHAMDRVNNELTDKARWLDERNALAAALRGEEG